MESPRNPRGRYHPAENTTRLLNQRRFLRRCHSDRPRTQTHPLTGSPRPAPVTEIQNLRRSTAGNKALKRVFFHSAFDALVDPESRAFYDRKRTEGKRHNQAVIALARRRLNVVWAILETRTRSTQDRVPGCGVAGVAFHLILRIRPQRFQYVARALNLRMSS